MQRGGRTVKRPGRLTFSLEDEYYELMLKITRRTRRSFTDEMRVLLDARAQALGITPVAPVFDDVLAGEPVPEEERELEMA